MQKLSSEVLENSRTVGALWVVEELFPDGDGGLCTLCAQLLPCPSMCQALLLGILPESPRVGPGAVALTRDNFFLPKLSFRPPEHGRLFSGHWIMQKGFSLYTGGFIFPYVFPC